MGSKSNMKTLAAVVVLAALQLALSGASQQETSKLVDYRLKLWKNNKNEDCKVGGLMCKNCRVVLCRQENGEWIQDPQWDCPLGQVCKNGACFKGEDPNCSPTEGLEFPCSSPGVFPDPGNCRKYHICGLDNSTGLYQTFPLDCENSDDYTNGYRYNARTYFCDQKLTTGKCPSYPIPLCKAQFETTALKENPSLYYTCVPHYPSNILYPYQFACPNGKKYSVTTGNCA